PVSPETINIALERGTVDFRIGWVREPLPSLRYSALFKDEFVCVASERHASIQGSISSDQYERYPHIRIRTSGQSDFWRCVDEATEKAGLRPRIAYIVPSFSLSPRTVANSDLIATIPYRVARRFASPFHL